MEKISIVIEVIAFFMVTTELYGEVRLNNLHDMLVALHASARYRLERGQKKSITFLNILMSVKNLSVVLLVVVATGTVISTMIFHRPYNSWPPELHTALFIFVLFLLWYEVSHWIGFNAVFLLTGLLIFVDVSVWLLRRAKFKGVLLAVGSILFVTAKALQFCAIDR